MPAPATHFIFAKSVEDEIAALDKSFNFSKPAFYYGTQGPDFLFSHKVWRMAWNGENLVELGSVLHHVCPSKMFALMKEYLETQNCDKDIVRSYIYGFLAHYALDRNAHPLVYAVQKALTKAHEMEDFRPIVVHNLIELNMDAILAKTEMGCVRSTDLKLYEAFDPNPYLIDEMASLMEYVVPQLVFCDASKSDFADAYRHMRMGQIALNNPSGMRRKIVQFIEKPVWGPMGGPLLSSLMRQPQCDNEWDYMNLAHREWTLVFDSRVKSTKSFFDLYRDAQKDIFSLIEAFNAEDAETALREYSGDMSFDDGVRYDIREPIA